jgi:hypothetical protein
MEFFGDMDDVTGSTIDVGGLVSKRVVLREEKVGRRRRRRRRMMMMMMTRRRERVFEMLGMA